MSKIFEHIIKKSNSKPSNIDLDNERLIIQDEKTGEFFYEENFSMITKSFFGRKYKYYTVNYNEYSVIKDLSCEISDPIKGMTIRLNFSFEISCIKGKAIKAIKFLKKSTDEKTFLERSFANWMRKFVEQHSNFTDDFLRLDDKIRSYIESQAERRGLRIRITKLEPIVSNSGQDFPPQHLTLVHKTKCEILDDYIEVKSKIVLNLVNRRAFSWRNIENPETWIKEKTNTIIQNELINKSFRDIVDDFESGLKQSISQKLEKEVREIGYSIQHIVSVPSEEIEEFLDGFTFELGDKYEYATSEAEIKVRLHVIVEGKGTVLKGIDRKYVKPRKSIIEEVKKLTLQTIAYKLRFVQPADFYITFFEKVRPNLEQEITKKLSDHFKLDTNDLGIFIQPLNTDLKERFDNLQAERGRIQIHSQSENTYYEIKYGVDFVNDWYVFHKNHKKYFQNTELEYTDISEYLKDKIELDFKRLASSVIDIINSRDLDNGIVELFENARQIIKEEFGLALNAPRLKRISSRGDISESEIFATGYLEKRESIKKELIEALKSGDDDLVEELSDSLKKVSSQINKIKSSNSISLNPSSDDTKKLKNSNEEENETEDDEK